MLKKKKGVRLVITQYGSGVDAKIKNGSKHVPATVYDRVE